MYAQQELALRLRKRQAQIQAEIAAQDPKAGVTGRLKYLVSTKYHTDTLLADLAAELGWQDGYHEMLDKEIAQREDAKRVWGQ